MIIARVVINMKEARLATIEQDQFTKRDEIVHYGLGILRVM